MDTRGDVMNFESRAFVRYGIPGWYFALSVFITLKYVGIDILDVTGLTGDLFSSVILVLSGVPVGYILYQFYFYNIHKKYKNDTPDWNIFVYSDVNVESREYINERYKHMLRKIHELGVLKITVFLSFLIVYLPMYFMYFSTMIELSFNWKFYLILISDILKQNINSETVLVFLSSLQDWDIILKKIIKIVIHTGINLIIFSVVSSNYEFKQNELRRYVEGIKANTKKHKTST